MKILVITGSITYAIMGRDILKKAGLPSEIKRQANSLKRLGCGYGIKTNEEGLKLLKESKIKILDIENLGEKNDISR